MEESVQLVYLCSLIKVFHCCHNIKGTSKFGEFMLPAFGKKVNKAPVKFQKDWPKTVGEVGGTRYLLKIWNFVLRTMYHGKLKTMSLCFFF